MCDIMMRLFALFMYVLNAIERAIFFVFSYTIPWKYCAFTNASASAHFYFISSFSIQHVMLFLLFSSEIRSLVDLRTMWSFFLCHVWTIIRTYSVGLLVRWITRLFIYSTDLFPKFGFLTSFFFPQWAKIKSDFMYIWTLISQLIIVLFCKY